MNINKCFRNAIINESLCKNIFFVYENKGIIFGRIKKYIKPHILGVLLLTVLMLFWLFIFPHGLADNGDFFRIIHNLGISHLQGTNEDNFFNYFSNIYHITNWYIDDKVLFVSTHSVIIAISIAINMVFNNEFYDIRFICFMYSSIYLISIYIILKKVEAGTLYVFSKYNDGKAVKYAWIFCGIIVFILGDFSYLLYFNSFFGEPLSYIAILMLIACIIKIADKQSHKVVWLTLFTVFAVLLVGAKQQNAPIGILVSIFALRLMILNREIYWKAFVSASALIIIVCSIVTYITISDEIAYINQYNSMTLGVMRYADNEDKIVELNLDPQLNILTDTTIYDRYPVALTSSPLLFEKLYNNISIAKIGVYYLKNYFALMRQLQSGAAQSFDIKPNVVGNYLKSSGKPPLTKTYFFSSYSLIKSNIMPHSIGFILIFYMIFFGACGYLYYRFCKSKFKAGIIAVEFSIIVSLIGVMQLVISVFGAGDADLAKHLFLNNMAFDIMLIIILFLGVYWIKYIFNMVTASKLNKKKSHKFI